VAKHRVTPHRAKTKEGPSKKELAELQRENHRLRREVARLQKYIDKLVATRDRQEAEEAEAPVLLDTKAFQCPNCHSEKIKMVQLGHRALRVCIDCAWRAML
jgi:septal ring factor EnvC (AmiA/AmiB activator)